MLAALAILVALAASGCGGSSDSESTNSSTSSAGSTDTTTSDTTATQATTETTPPDASAQARASLVAGIRSSLLGSSLPGGYTSCVLDKAESEITDAQIMTLIKTYAAGNRAAAKQLGVTLGKECIAEGAGIDEFRAKFVATIRQGLAGSGLSAAYGACVLKKANTEIPDDQLSRILLEGTSDSPAAQAHGRAIGRRLGQECQDQGIKP